MADLHSTLVRIDINYGQAARLSPLVERITANNPSPFTGPGTNTYIVSDELCTVVIDPGPNEPEHIAAILAATENKIDFILATHTHEDHSPAGKPLALASGAKLIGLACDGLGEHLDDTFKPLHSVSDGERLEFGGFVIQAIYSPGHIKDHVCFLLEGEQMLFAGDHIMQGATVVIVPPHGGTIGDYLRSLAKLSGTGIKMLAPAHGHLLAEPDQVMAELSAHRLKREARVIEVMIAQQRGTVEALAPLVYPEVRGDLIWGTHVALWSHLQKLVEDGMVRRKNDKHWMVGSTTAEEIWEWIGEDAV